METFSKEQHQIFNKYISGKNILLLVQVVVEKHF